MSIFKFKKFQIIGNQLVYPLTTDSVLIGSWAQITQAKNVVDIGTGTGILALIIATRHNKANIWAIDINQKACELAKNNVTQSGLQQKIKIYNDSAQHFKPPVLIDYWIMNPPYFLNGKHSLTPEMALAKHTLSWPWDSIIQNIKQNSQPNFMVGLIFPFMHKHFIVKVFLNNGLYLKRLCIVKSFKNSLPVLCMAEFCMNFEKPKTKTQTIYLKPNTYTSWYKSLTKKLYL